MISILPVYVLLVSSLHNEIKTRLGCNAYCLSGIRFSEVNATTFTLSFPGMKYLHQEKTMHRDLKSSNGNLPNEVGH